MERDFYSQLKALEDTNPEDGGGIRFSNHTHLAVKVDHAYDSAHAREWWKTECMWNFLLLVLRHDAG